LRTSPSLAPPSKEFLGLFDPDLADFSTKGAKVKI